MAWGRSNISGGSPEAWLLENTTQTKEMLGIDDIEAAISTTNEAVENAQNTAAAAASAAAAAQTTAAAKAPSDIITAGATDLTAGTSTGTPNTFYFVYEVNLITFTVGGTSYTAEEGMTWEQWVNSSYNTAGFYIECSLNMGWNVEFYVPRAANGGVFADDTTTAYGCSGPLASDAIRSGYAYVWSA